MWKEEKLMVTCGFDQLGCLKGHSTDLTHQINYGDSYYVQTEV